MSINKIKILLDAGHGNPDRSNQSPDGKYIEADGNLNFVLKLRDLLLATEKFDVYLTRDKDEGLSLTTRGKKCKDMDIGISFHSDAYNEKSFGVTVFDSVEQKNEELGTLLGKSIANAMDTSFRGCREKESTKYKDKDYYTFINKAVSVGCPITFIIERGFHSNPSEAKKLMDDNYVMKSAIATKDVLVNWFFKDEQPTTPQAKLGLITNVKKSANIRVAPNHNSIVQNTLNLNTEVLLRYECDGTYVDNNNGKWWRIRYEKNGRWHDGYISASKINRTQ